MVPYQHSELNDQATKAQAILVGERLTGKGVLQSLQMSTGVPLWEIEPVLGLLVGVLVAAAVYPAVRFLIARGAQAGPHRTLCLNLFLLIRKQGEWLPPHNHLIYETETSCLSGLLRQTGVA